MHREHEFVWAPYTDDIVADLPPGYAVGSDLWVARVPLICFHIVEWHLPDRVMRQFGFRQGIPGRFCTSGVDVRGEDLHEIDGCSQGNTDWAAEHAMYVSMWVHRHDYIVEGVRADGPMRLEDLYYAWYRSITRRFVDRTAAVYMSYADVLHQVNSLSSDPAVSDLARVGLDIVYEDERRIPTPRRTPAP
ncbi:serine/threonine-protein phosphatase 7 long form homolog [Malania oleifera]|uniref:serine/threonine-protein phosphatase 7 long form homolog n=1 Tax=Malania oleifera TaxID=397392 RepID=UPI0025AE06EC|nr:serine/threonine-protein phosphatase 7 long form homolog [Malania oleifera]